MDARENKFLNDDETSIKSRKKVRKLQRLLHRAQPRLHNLQKPLQKKLWKAQAISGPGMSFTAILVTRIKFAIISSSD